MIELLLFRTGAVDITRGAFAPWLDASVAIERVVAPVWSALIRTPEGNIVFDTGLHPVHVSNPYATFGKPPPDREGLAMRIVMKEEDGSVHVAELADFDGDGTTDLAVFEGAGSGLLDDDDVTEGGSVLKPGSSGAVLIYENRWAAPFAAALRRGGAEVVAAGFIPQDSILESLDASEPSSN